MSERDSYEIHREALDKLLTGQKRLMERVNREVMTGPNKDSVAYWQALLLEVLDAQMEINQKVGDLVTLLDSRLKS